MKYTLLTLSLAMLGMAKPFAQQPRFMVEGNAKRVVFWSGKDPHERTGYFDDWSLRQQVQIVPTANGAIVRTEGQYWYGTDVLRMETTDRSKLEVAVYRYDFNQDGSYEGFIVYSPKPGEAHMLVYRYINDEKPWLIGKFQGLDRFTLKGPLVIVPYEYFYEEHAYTRKYAYYDRDFYEMVRHDPEEGETGK